jgi:hypothetical protein
MEERFTNFNLLVFTTETRRERRITADHLYKVFLIYPILEISEADAQKYFVFLINFFTTKFPYIRHILSHDFGYNLPNLQLIVNTDRRKFFCLITKTHLSQMLWAAWFKTE